MMRCYTSSVAVPPSPNWYTSHASDVSLDGSLYAYAAHRFVVVVDPRKGEILHQLSAHKGRVTCLAFMKNRHMRHFIVTGSSDKTLILWDALSGKPVKAITGHKNEIISISSFQTRSEQRNAAACRTSTFVGDFVSVDKSNVGFTWDVCKSEKPLHKFQLSDHFSGALCTFNYSELSSDSSEEKGSSPNQLGSCICYGSTKGAVSLVDVVSGNLIQSWQCHSKEVCELRSVSKPSDEVSSSGHFLLMTTSKNGEAKLHVARNEGQDMTALFKPALLLCPAKKLASNEEVRNWTSCLFRMGCETNEQCEDLCLLSNLKGQIWTWCPGAAGRAATSGSKLHIAYHNRPIFRLDSLPEGALLSCSMDRQAACFNRDKSLRWSFRGFGAHSQCVSASLASGKLAVGCGDSTIRIYEDNLAKTKSLKSVEETKFLWSGLQKLKFSWVSFHPRLDDLVIFASEEGSIGVYDLDLDKVAFFSSKDSSHRHPQWKNEVAGSAAENNDIYWSSAPKLYTLYSGQLHTWHKDIRQWGNMHGSKVHNEVKFNPCLTGKDPIKAFSWSLCGKYLAIATDTNDIYICWETEDTCWQDLGVIYKFSQPPATDTCSISGISCLSMEHESRYCESNGDVFTILAGHEDGSILRMIIRRFSGGGGEDAGGSSVTMCYPSSRIMLDAHKHEVKCIVVNPASRDQWASVARGESHIKVWHGCQGKDATKLKEGPIPGGVTEPDPNLNPPWDHTCTTLEGHQEGVLSVCWSTGSPRCLYSVSEDQSMRLWKG